ncbi:tetratricopeptide repeat protein [Aquimarina sp. 2201CG5-10]|uniref:tetratricopeptide repeat protein n=1 Tax=Aquimarina callyspongiae TaxID=3098150 RepID=UPI002AB354EF|nr:tetratricopeptide repeat protein [Aquimarina sp. 2201CG5-10]MDY8138032.1 tetratricopeptide repeat protein [Aquimarina sp. 2201CG5-10]
MKFGSLFYIIVFNCLFSFSQKVDTTLIRLETNLKNATTDSSRVEVLLKLADYQKRRDYNKVKLYTSQIFKILENVDYDVRTQKARAFNMSGIANRRNSDFTLALKDYLAAQKILLETKDSLELGSNYHNIAMIYRFQNDWDKSIANFKKAIVINQKNNRSIGLGNNYGMMAVCYEKKNQSDSVFYYFDKALSSFKKGGFEEGAKQVLGNKAAHLSYIGRYEEALPIQLEYLEYVKSINKKLSVISTHINLSNTYLGLKQYDKGLIHANKAIETGKKDNAKLKLRNAYHVRSKIYKSLNNFELALDDYRTFTKIDEDVYDNKRVKELHAIELKYKFAKQMLTDSIRNTEEKKRMIIQAENEELKQRWYLTLLISTVLVSTFIIYSGSVYLKKRKKKNQIREASLTNKIDKLSSEVTSENEEITKLREETIIHLQTKEKLTKELSKLSDEAEGLSLEGIISELATDKLEDDKLKVLKKNIEILNSEFLQRLQEKHVNLTKTDIEICSFIKLGLSRNEIAQLRKTSLSAIKSTRFRLKKKLQLTADQSLDDYVKHL